MLSVIQKPVAGGGVVYTRWGKSSCPDTEGTELLYAGRMGGKDYAGHGGGSNYLCLPNNPQYLGYESGVQGDSNIYGAKYGTSGGPLSSSNYKAIPCAVCFSSNRSTHVMIPARIECPTSWTREYYGYIMAEAVKYGTRPSTMYECVDHDPDTLPDVGATGWPAVLYLVEVVCEGIACPPYSAEKELTCVMCTK